MHQESVRLGVRHQRRHGAAEDDPPTPKQRDSIGETANLFDALCRPDHGDAALLGQRAHQCAHTLRSLRIEIVGCLVDEQHGRVREQRACHAEPLLHPVGVDADANVHRVLEPHLLHRLLRARDGLSSPEPVEPSEEDEVLKPGDPVVERPVDGRDEADPLTQLLRILGGIEPRRLHRPGVGMEESDEDAQQRRLPSPVRAEQRVDLAGANDERHGIERLLLTERTRDIDSLDDGRRRRGRLVPLARHNAGVSDLGGHPPTHRSSLQIDRTPVI